MPLIGTPQTPDPTTLEQISKIPMDYAGDRYQMLQNMRASDADAMQRMQTLRDLNTQQQQANLAQTQAQTAEANARLQGITADAAGKQRDWQVRQGIPVDTEINAQLQKMLADESDSNLKILNNHARSQLDDAAKKYGVDSPQYKQAYAIWQGSSAEQSRRLKAQDALDLEEAKARSALAVAGVAAKSRVDVATLRNQYNSKIQESMMKLHPDQRLGWLQQQIAIEESKPDGGDQTLLNSLRAQQAAVLTQINTDITNRLRQGLPVQDANGNWGPPQPVPQVPVQSGRPTPNPVPQLIPQPAVVPNAQTPPMPVRVPAGQPPMQGVNPQPNIKQGPPASAGWPAQPAPAGKVWARNVRTGQLGLIPQGSEEQAMQEGYEVKGR